mmetsp:Transcript_88813/g.237657  ORF Transcript_88813/g.237657 Transcript_88813/m.237657 type:complete len:729 (+) Transcript_88813:90-2276(+)
MWLLVVSLAVAAEEEEASDVAVAIASTLIGSISICMMLFYLLNWPDADIRRYSYDVISATCSIFCAVLLFDTFQDTLEVYLLDGRGIIVNIVANFAHQLVWFTVMQFTLAHFAMAHKSPEDRKEVINGEGTDDTQMNMRCVGVLLSHMTGFAAINSWGSVQQTSWFRQTPAHSLAVLPMALAVNVALQRLTDTFRSRLTEGDGIEDELEKMWDEEVEEAENDISGLSLSFLASQSLRFWVGGTLANEEGWETSATQYEHTCRQIVLLMSCAAGFIVLTVVLLVKVKVSGKPQTEEEGEEHSATDHHSQHSAEEEEDEEEEEGGLSERFAEMLLTAFSMSFAWSIFYSARWGIAATQWTGQDQTLLGVVLAVLLSLICFASIYILDKLADADFTDEVADEAIYQVIGAIGILIGFSWEQCFDAALSSLASATSNEHFTKLLLAIFCVVMLVPAWRLYILPMVVQHGWRFGFLPDRVTEHLDHDDEAAVEEYERMLLKLTSCGKHGWSHEGGHGHGGHDRGGGHGHESAHGHEAGHGHSNGHSHEGGHGDSHANGATHSSTRHGHGDAGGQHSQVAGAVAAGHQGSAHHVPDAGEYAQLLATRTKRQWQSSLGTRRTLSKTAPEEIKEPLLEQPQAEPTEIRSSGLSAVPVLGSMVTMAQRHRQRLQQLELEKEQKKEELIAKLAGMNSLDKFKATLSYRRTELMPAAGNEYSLMNEPVRGRGLLRKEDL